MPSALPSTTDSDDDDRQRPAARQGRVGVLGRRLPELAPGLLAAAVAATAATLAARWLPIVGAPVFGIVFGVLLGPVARRLDVPVAAGARFASRYVLQGAIVVFGTGLSLGTVARVGLTSLPVMLGTLAACLAMAWLAGRVLRVRGELRLLIAAGTGICGASAIGAVAPVITASEAAVAYAMSTIFIFNVAAVLVFPAIGHLLGLTAHGFGLWAGTAINDTSSVTAAGYAYSRAAGDFAVVVKLARALMIIPLVLAVSVFRPASERGAATPGRRPRVLRLIPPFLPLFLLAAAARTVGLVPPQAHHVLATVAIFGVAMAMAGIGLGLRLADLRRAGARPLLFGGVLSLTVAVVGLALQTLLG